MEDIAGDENVNNFQGVDPFEGMNEQRQEFSRSEGIGRLSGYRHPSKAEWSAAWKDVRGNVMGYFNGNGGSSQNALGRPLGMPGKGARLKGL